MFRSAAPEMYVWHSLVLGVVTLRDNCVTQDMWPRGVEEIDSPRSAYTMVGMSSYYRVYRPTQWNALPWRPEVDEVAGQGTWLGMRQGGQKTASVTRRFGR